MAFVYYRAFRTRGVFANVPAFRDEMLKWMDGQARNTILFAARRRTFRWKADIKFDVRSHLSSAAIFSDLVVEGSGARFWFYVSRGVSWPEGRYIYAKRRYSPRGLKRGHYYPATLRLARYHPRTKAGGVYGGAGRYAKAAYRQAVWWPGIEPRNFEQDILDEMGPQLRRGAENAARRAIRRAQREGY